jgi:dienelactone hydrolase
VTVTPSDGANGLRYESEALHHGPLPQRRVSFELPEGRASGLLAIPPDHPDPMPAAFYLHGLGADSSSLAAEALLLAARGVMTLSLDAADAGAPALPPGSLDELGQGVHHAHATIVRVRAAHALLAGDPRVDSARIAFVGISRGAAVGVLATAEIDEIAAEVYVSGGAGHASWLYFAERLPASDRDEAERLLAPFDPGPALARARAQRPRLVQFGSEDELLSQEALQAFADAVPEPKQLTVRPRRHALDVREARERVAWLEHELGARGGEVQGPPIARHPRRR